MSFANPVGPSASGGALRNTLRLNHSTDSFERGFDDSLDAALDNLQIDLVDERQDPGRDKDFERRESFELDTLHNFAVDSRRNRTSADNDTPFLLDDSLNEDVDGDVGHNSHHDKLLTVNRHSTRWKPGFLHGILSATSAKLFTGRQGGGGSSHSEDREIPLHLSDELQRGRSYCSNEISNAKYNFITFVPILLYGQFKFFYNLYFLAVAVSQAVPILRIGYLSSYVVPLAFVLTVTMMKEAFDDIQRRNRDRELNNGLYNVIQKKQLVTSKDLKVGDMIKLSKGDRVPADSVLLQTNESTGEAFIKTDQLDGETDWKLRTASPVSQNLSLDDIEQKIVITASKPEKSIHSFLGKITYNEQHSLPLSIDNTLWANTVVASTATCIACIIYTGKDTRQSLNTTKPKVKTGLLELEINSISKLLCISVFLLSAMLVAFAGFNNNDWYIDIMRYLILFSTIIPVSLRVNLDLSKSVYAYQIEHDQTIPETIVRTSTIPEDLGRIEYLLSDKTGTLTENDMELKKIHLGSISYSTETMDMVVDYIKNAANTATNGKNNSAARKSMSSKVCDMIFTLALCHNVTPSIEDDQLVYQAASPDEIAIIKFTESVGVSLFKRDRHTISLLHNSSGEYFNYQILYLFPFNSDTKRMGVIVLDEQTDTYWFLEKGADVVMAKIVENNSWLEEEVANMAREGLRTLVVGRKKLSRKAFDQFCSEYKNASLEMNGRDDQMASVVSKYLEHELELLGLTGVEDKLQKDVKPSIELLRNAGIKIWMLTGDKVETARCVSINAKLISRGQYVHVITKLNDPDNALHQLKYLHVNRTACLLIDGESLATYLQYHREAFFAAVVSLPTVVACRCTPQQKADIALIIREMTGKRVCCIGDGGNDVSMIQCADVGVGIVGKEGKQASLAADFSITQFCHLTELLLWHGRNSYKRSAKLAQFVMHRGLVIAICQAVFSICSEFEPIALYQGWLMVGYATCYTMAPVFSLTLDTDIKKSLAKLYPELYKDLIEGKSLSHKTFFVWVALSIFQGSVIQLFSQAFTGSDETHFLQMVALSFTALVFNELLMVALEIYTWTRIMAITELVTILIYSVSVPFLAEYFDLTSFTSPKIYIRVLIIVTISVFPVWASKAVYRKMHPPSHAKVQLYTAS